MNLVDFSDARTVLGSIELDAFVNYLQVAGKLKGSANYSLIRNNALRWFANIIWNLWSKTRRRFQKIGHIK